MGRAAKETIEQDTKARAGEDQRCRLWDAPKVLHTQFAVLRARFGVLRGEASWADRSMLNMVTKQVGLVN